RGHIDRFSLGLAVDVKGLLHVWRYTVECRARLHCDIHVWDVADLWGRIWLGEDCLAKVCANLLPVHLKRGDERNVLDLVGSETGMHEAGCETVLSRRVLPVILYPLDECAGTISNPGECDFDLSHLRNDSGSDPLLARRIINLRSLDVRSQMWLRES